MCYEIKNANERANPGKYTDGIFSGIQERNQYGLIHCVFGLFHGIGQCADSFNFANYGVTAFQEAGGLHSHAYACRSTGSNHCACFECHTLAQFGDNLGNVGDELIGSTPILVEMV